MTEETLKERDARLNAWLENVKPGDIVTVRLNSTDTLTGKVYEAPDARGTSLCVNNRVLRHGNGYPGGDYDLVEKPAEIKVFIVNEDTIPEIAKVSGLSEAVLHDMLDYDREFELTTKLYIPPSN